MRDAARKMDTLPAILTQAEAATALGVDRKVLQRAEIVGFVTPVRYGRSTYYVKEQVLDLAERRRDLLK
jgi:hypothetical protein